MTHSCNTSLIFALERIIHALFKNNTRVAHWWTADVFKELIELLKCSQSIGQSQSSAGCTKFNANANIVRVQQKIKHDYLFLKTYMEAKRIEMITFLTQRLLCLPKNRCAVQSRCVKAKTGADVPGGRLRASTLSP